MCEWRMKMPDLDLLKAVTDGEVADWASEAAVSSVLAVLRNHPDNTILWDDIYHAVKESYVPRISWGDEDEEAL